MGWAEMTGRERDALVAEKVMGWARCDDTDCDGCDCPIMTVGMGEVYIRHPATGALGWAPTTDISAAWEVVEKMHADNWAPSCEYDNEDRVWWAYFDRYDPVTTYNYGDPYCGEATTAPEAIALAALRALGVDV